MDHDGQVSTSIEARLDFPAPAPVVWQMLIDPAYIDFKRARLGDFEFALAQTPDTTQLIFTRPLSAELPAAAAAIVGAAAQIVEIQNWAAASSEGNRTAAITITVGQAPARIVGDAVLKASANGTEISINLTISVGVPLFGAAAEQLIKTELDKHITAEQQLGNDWLRQQ